MKRRIKVQTGNPHPLGRPISPDSEIISKFNGERSIIDAYLLHARRGDRARTDTFEKLMRDAIEKASRPVVHDAM